VNDRERRLARLTAAAAAHCQVWADARRSRDGAWLDAYTGADGGQAMRMPEIAAASGAPLGSVHRGITREQAAREREEEQ